MAVVLVIEDDTQSRRMIMQALARAGHEVIESADGEAGLAAYRARTPDVVLVDLIMPRKEGIETIVALGREPVTRPLIAMSGGSRAMDARDLLVVARRLGARRVLAKPFALGELRRAVDEVLAPSS